jgi:hypothetical protein
MRWATPGRSRDWCSTPRRRSAYALLAIVLGALAATLFRPPPTSGPLARDFEAYYAAGATWNAGGDPWSRDVWRVERTIPGVDASRDELLPYAGPAAALPLWSALARLPFDVARTVWLALLAFALLALGAAALALGERAPPPADLASALLFAAVSGPAISAFALGQAALVAAAAVALALLALERRSPWAIAAAFAAGIQPNLALPLAVRLTQWRSAAGLCAAGLAFIAVTFAAGGVRGAAAYAQRLAAHGAAERFSAIQYGVPAIAASFGLARGAANAAGAACALVALAAAVTAALRLRERPLYAAAIAIALLPWIVPFFHEHDFALDLIPVLVLAVVAEGRVRALTAAGAVLTLVDWFGVAQRPAGAAQTACLALALACAFAALPRRAPDAAPAVALAAAALTAAVAVPLALAFPAPVWPDALGPFHAAAGLDASAVWAAEQTRSGLTASVPAWGVLRALPLAGCALLALAALQAANAARVRPASAPPR